VREDLGGVGFPTPAAIRGLDGKQCPAAPVTVAGRFPISET
jgi:hypothetical protein